jgi:hypothetical protein
LKSVDPQLESAWFQPLNLKCNILVSKVAAFTCNLYRYSENAARENLRRKAERRVYRPASVWIIGKLMVMYGGLIVLLYVDVFLTALACYVNPAAESMNALGDYAWNCLCCFSLLGRAAHLSLTH